MTGHLYLHGFASGARSTKGVALAAAFARRGVELRTPDLNVPTFETMTYSSMLDEIDRIDREAGVERWNLLGSSLGGYLAARWAQRRPDRVDRLVLLCPAFDLSSRWPAVLGEAAFAAWRRRGWHAIEDGAATTRRLAWSFIEDAARHPPWPEPVRPTLVVHGSRDDVVAPEISARWARGRPQVRRIVVDDDHRLLASIERIEAEAAAFLGLPPAG